MRNMIGKKLTKEIVESRLKARGLNYKMVSPQYKNENEKLEWKCLDCEREWSTTWKSLKVSSKCKKCTPKKKLSKHDTINSEIKTRGLNVTFIKYKDNIITLECCNCGLILSVSLAYLRGKQENICVCNSKYKRYSYEDIKKKIEHSNLIKLTTTKEDYINIGEKCDFSCNRCGHNWAATPSNIINNNTGCPECKNKYKGFYGIIFAERNKAKLQNLTCNVYIVELYSESEVFYKIGYTTKTIKERMKPIPYKYKIIHYYSLNRYDGIYKEHHLHTINRKNRYIPLRSFGGHKECYKNKPNIL